MDMAKSVPTKNSGTGAISAGARDGLPLALGEILGRLALGPGAGTAIGGTVAAATEVTDDGNITSTGETMALIAVERGANELMGA